MLIGAVGDAFKWDQPQTPSPTALTPDEQYSYMSMWALMAAPLFFGGDMASLDDFTLGILCNSEVIDIDQDALGWQARVVRQSADEFILEKPLEDGSVAVGLFNLSDSPRKITASLTDLGLNGGRKVRDLWRQKEIGIAPFEILRRGGPAWGCPGAPLVIEEVRKERVSFPGTQSGVIPFEISERNVGRAIPAFQ